MRINKRIERFNAITVTQWGQSLNPVVREIYANRGVTSDSELDQSLSQLLPYHMLKNIEPAAMLLADAIIQKKSILIVGDFDVDGATSTVIALRVLRACGVREVNYLVPNRFNFGYGITPPLVEVAKQFKPDLIVTVDNGIANHDGVQAAIDAGFQVLVTDHHLAADTLPAANVIVNPNLPGDKFPSKSLAGVGVIFYVMIALRAELRKRDWFTENKITAPNMASYLDIVALGTVADVVPLDRNNRLLVALGLRRIRAGKCVPGITALLEVGKRVMHNTVAADLGFAVGPRLNAAGRMDDMSHGIECLLTDDIGEARERACKLDQFNQARKQVETDMQEQALVDLKKLRIAKDNMPYGVCLFDAKWHQGVIGILASRIKDRLHRPVIVFAKESETTIKGSARSINGVHIRDILATIEARHPGLMIKFGGHAMAAGLSMLAGNFERFKAVFALEITNMIDAKDMEGVLASDGELGEQDLTLRFAEMLEEAGPWGQHFAEPIFDGRFKIVDQRILGGKHIKLSVIPAGGSKIVDAIYFNADIAKWPGDRCQIIHLAYRVNINEFKGYRKLQLMVEQLEPLTVIESID